MSRDVEDLESFRARARSFVRGNLRPDTSAIGILRHVRGDEEELAAVAREREVQRMLFDADLAGICISTEYGGQGLTPAHQVVLNEELEGYEYPSRFQSPTFAPCTAVLLDFGTEEQKQRHIPAILRGEEIWMQFLSEPSGGSDVAGALTTALRDGDEWILNGSKVWTTGAWWSDWALCLARTNWDVQKHRGLTVFMLPLRQPGIEVHRIEMLNGSKEFCQEFLSDVRVPDSDRVGEVDDGWTVGSRWMFHERMAFNSPLVTVPAGTMRPCGRSRRMRDGWTTRAPSISSARSARSTWSAPRSGAASARASPPARCPTSPRRSAACSPASRPHGAPRSPSSSPVERARRGPTMTGPSQGSATTSSCAR
jgi:alkylation response protein AidB-like acyl-CoA dehydrogenase